MSYIGSYPTPGSVEQNENDIKLNFVSNISVSFQQFHFTGKQTCFTSDNVVLDFFSIQCLYFAISDQICNHHSLLFSFR